MSICRRRFFSIEHVGIIVAVPSSAAAFIIADGFSGNTALEFKTDNMHFTAPRQFSGRATGGNNASFPLYLPDTDSITLINKLPDIPENTYIIPCRQSQNAEIYVD